MIETYFSWEKTPVKMNSDANVLQSHNHRCPIKLKFYRGHLLDKTKKLNGSDQLTGSGGLDISSRACIHACPRAQQTPAPVSGLLLARANHCSNTKIGTESGHCPLRHSKSCIQTVITKQNAIIGTCFLALHD